MDKKCDSEFHLCEAAIFADIPNTVLDVYENETGKEPVPEEGGHTQDFDDWFIKCVFDAWDNKGVRTLEGLVEYFKKRHPVDLDRMTDRRLLEEFADRVLAYENSQTALHEWERENAWAEDSEFNACLASATDREHELLMKHNSLVLENDENFCRVRECVRLIKKDDSLLEC
jgi:hypothetical protein